MTWIKAAVCREFGADLTIEEVELRAPQAGEVEVKIAACAICHSDLSFISGGWGGPLPAVYGHEAAGHVTAIGPGVTGYAPGDAVVVTLIRACGTCPACAGGQPVQCGTRYDKLNGPLSASDGGPMVHGLAVGGFAERVVVDRSQIARLPAEMPMDAAALLGCGVITGVGAVVNTARLRPGQNAVVIGCGGVGLSAIQGARIAGAARIIAVDSLASKLEVAREFGATDTILAEGEPWKEAVRLLGRPADAVFVTVGVATVYETAPKYLGRSGQMVLVGIPHNGAEASYLPAAVAAQGQFFKGSLMGDTVLVRDIPWMVELYTQGRLKLDELISGRWRLDQINAAIADTQSGAARRNVILFD